MISKTKFSVFTIFAYLNMKHEQTSYNTCSLIFTIIPLYMVIYSPSANSTLTIHFLHIFTNLLLMDGIQEFKFPT